ncbi:MAG: hypothetical protein RBS78_03420 [Coriobacteriia bacterium]|jgi:hypothetical protein|nr:hypothetical protein [Coriobacteriia bacterium]
MRWTRARHDEFEYVRLTPQGAVIGPVKGVEGGRITENLNTSLKASGVLDMSGASGADDFKDDLIRVILHATEGDETQSVVLGTFLAATPSRVIDEGSVHSEVDLYSLLLILEEDAFEHTLSIEDGSNAVALAASIAEAAGLSVVVTPSPAVTASPLVFEAGTSRLEVINHLLEYAGYGSANIDGFGRVVIAPYRDPAERSPVWTFTDGEEGIFLPDIDDELDWYHTPNVVVVVASDPESSMVAVATNDDPLSPYSTVSRGRRIVRHEETDADTYAALVEKAELLLSSGSATVHKDTIVHTYAPVGLGDVVRLRYEAAMIDYTMVVQSREMRMAPGVPTTTTLRRFIRG